MTIANVSISIDDARELDRRIDQAFGDGFALLAEAFRTAAWLTLDYPSWDDYLATKAGTARQRIPAEERAQVFGRLRDAGMSDRQIAAATGISQPTVSRSFSDSFVSHDDLETDEEERDDDIITEREWRAAEPEPDIMAGHSNPDIDRRIDELKDARFAENVRRVFYSIARAETRFDIDRIAEVALTNSQFEATLRDDIAESRRWFKQIDAALAANPNNNIRSIRRVK